MYTILILCTVFYVGITVSKPHGSLPPEVIELLKSSIDKCSTAKYASADIIKLIESGKYKEDDVFQEQLGCAFKVSGYTNEDGTVILEKAAGLFPDPSAVMNVIKDCNKNVGTSVENTYHFFKCFQNTSKLHLKIE